MLQKEFTTYNHLCQMCTIKTIWIIFYEIILSFVSSHPNSVGYNIKVLISRMRVVEGSDYITFVTSFNVCLLYNGIDESSENCFGISCNWAWFVDFFLIDLCMQENQMVIKNNNMLSIIALYMLTKVNKEWDIFNK